MGSPSGLTRNGHSSPSSSSTPSAASSPPARTANPSKSAAAGSAVPQIFGYIKRSTGPSIVANDCGADVPAPNGSPRSTAHVLAIPRGNKVSGVTQMNTVEQNSSLESVAKTTLSSIGSPHQQHRSCSLTGPTAAQLNQSMRERLQSGSHSLPKQHGTNGSEQMAMFQQQQHHHNHQRISAALSQHHHQHHHLHHQHRGSAKLNDGSVSDTQTYVDVKPEYSSYAAWLKHSQTANSRLSECDSMENLGLNTAGSGCGAIQRAQKLMHRDSSYSHSPRLNRSNSIR